MLKPIDPRFGRACHFILVARILRARLLWGVFSTFASPDAVGHEHCHPAVALPALQVFHPWYLNMPLVTWLWLEVASARTAGTDIAAPFSSNCYRHGLSNFWLMFGGTRRAASVCGVSPAGSPRRSLTSSTSSYPTKSQSGDGPRFRVLILFPALHGEQS
jgi:hypothetical protein